VGFAFSSKDRVNFTVPTLASIDAEGDFDIIWVDGSDTPEGKQLPNDSKFKNARLVEVHTDVRGGPDRAICFGLQRLLDLGYDFCGLMENDMVLQPGWYRTLLGLFALAASDGIVCGAATVRGYQSRVMEYRKGYFLCWCIGAGMVLFSRPAAQLIVDRYSTLRARARVIYRFYAEVFGLDLRGLWDLWYGAPDHLLGMDWGYSPLLYEHGFASIGSIPSMMRDLEFDPRGILRTDYVSADKDNTGVACRQAPPGHLLWMRLTDPFFEAAWRLMKSRPLVYRWVRSLHRARLRSQGLPAVPGRSY
jgi:hypothetical protein